MKLKIIWSSICVLLSYVALAQPTTIGGEASDVVIDKIVSQIGDNII
jgi:hypothetical protein